MSILGQGPVTLRRYSAGTWGTDGTYTPGSTTDTTIYATVQPLSGRELQTLTEAERVRDGRKAYTETALRVASLDGQTLADRILYEGVWYEVRSILPQPAILPHYKATLLAVQETEE